MKTGVILINLGTPDSASTKDVRKYLREFLMDGRVIDIPKLNRWMLVNLIIAPIRGPKSAKEYKKIFKENGSPLLHYGEIVKDKLQKVLPNNYVVDLAMRYQNPSMDSVFEKFNNKGFEKLILIPLYPQYASATTGSTIQKAQEIISKWNIIPELEIVSHFPSNAMMIDSFAENAEELIEKDTYDHYLFSYHGLPERQIHRGSCDNYCKLGSCCDTYHSKNSFCYRAQCFETTRKLAQRLNIKEEDYSVCFQSRLGRAEWVKPYTEDTIISLAKQGKKKVLCFSPAFVADCLETIVEISEEYQEVFEEHGGEKMQLVPSLNDKDKWVKTLEEMVLSFEK